MAGRLGGQVGSRVSSEINVTPLVDVVLVLLIIFMVVTPLLHRGKSVELPDARNVEAETSAEPLVVTVTADGRLWLETRELGGVADAERRIVEELERTPGRVILLKGDERLDVGEVREIMRAARRAGARGISLAVAEPSPGRP